MTTLYHFQQVITLGTLQPFKPLIVDHQYLCLGQLREYFAEAAVVVRQCQQIEQAARTVVTHRDSLFAGVLSQSTG